MAGSVIQVEIVHAMARLQLCTYSARAFAGWQFANMRGSLHVHCRCTENQG